jgi:archaellum component FlaG (FlaF/FlaG flagellin family)
MWQWFQANSLIVSLAALVVAVLAYHTSMSVLHIHRARESERIAETRRAILKPELVHHWDSGGYHLFICNTGLCEARSVEVIVDGHPLAKHPDRVRITGDLPVTTIAPGMRMRSAFSSGLTGALNPPRHVVVTWQDDSGKEGRTDTELTVW